MHLSYNNIFCCDNINPNIQFGALTNPSKGIDDSYKTNPEAAATIRHDSLLRRKATLNTLHWTCLTCVRQIYLGLLRCEFSIRRFLIRFDIRKEAHPDAHHSDAQGTLRRIFLFIIILDGIVHIMWNSFLRC